jgi:hypothetical protein
MGCNKCLGAGSWDSIHEMLRILMSGDTKKKKELAQREYQFQ